MHPWVVVVLVGCYQPTAAIGIPCSQSGDCPVGQECDLDRKCNLRGTNLFDADPPITDAVVDSRDGDVPIDTATLGPWGAPQPLSSLNTVSTESDPFMSADGLEIVFSSTRPGGAGGTDIYRATRISTVMPFETPVRVVELCTSVNERSPELSSDGLTIYFTRVLAGNFDVFRATRVSRAMPFTNVARDNMLSTTAVERNVGISGDELIAIVDHDIAAGNREMFIHTRSIATGAWGPPVQLTELTTPYVEGGAALDHSGLTLFFHTDRVTQDDIFDLYTASRASTSVAFSMITPVTELNTSGSENDPCVTPDLRTLVFERDEDLYISTR